MEACGCLAGFLPRITEDAFLRLPRCPVEIHLLVGTPGYTHPPCAALVLTHKDDPVLSALVDRTRRACTHAARVQTVIAYSRQIEKHHALQFKDLPAVFFTQRLVVRVICGINGRTAEVIVPVRSCFYIDGLSCY